MAYTTAPHTKAAARSMKACCFTSSVEAAMMTNHTVPAICQTRFIFGEGHMAEMAATTPRMWTLGKTLALLSASQVFCKIQLQIFCRGSTAGRRSCPLGTRKQKMVAVV